jgi:hypothetical protein
VDSAGNTYQGYSSGDTGNPFIGIVKYDTDGNVVWREEYIGSSISGLCIDSNDDVIVSGATSTTPYHQAVMKISPANGAIIWQRNLESGDFGSDRSIDVDSSNNIYAQIFEFGEFFIGTSNIYKLNSSGVLQWQKGGGVDGVEFIIPSGIVVYNDGTVREMYFADSTVISAFDTSTGNYVSNQYTTGRYNMSITLDSSNNEYMCLQSLTTDVLFILKKPANSTSNTWVIRPDPVLHAGAEQDRVSISYDSVNDTVYASIASNGALKIFAFDGSTGSLDWQKQIDYSGQSITMLTLGNKSSKYHDGNIYVSISIGSTTSSRSIVVKFDATGNVADGTYGNFVVSTPTHSFSSITLSWNDVGNFTRTADPTYLTNTTPYSAATPTIIETNTGLG